MNASGWRGRASVTALSFAKLKLSGSELKQLPDPVKGYFLLSCLISDDLAGHTQYALTTSPYLYDPKDERAVFSRIRFHLSLRMTAVQIWEFNKALSSFRSTEVARQGKIGDLFRAFKHDLPPAKSLSVM